MTETLKFKIGDEVTLTSPGKAPIQSRITGTDPGCRAGMVYLCDDETWAAAPWVAERISDLEPAPAPTPDMHAAHVRASGANVRAEIRKLGHLDSAKVVALFEAVQALEVAGLAGRS